MLKAVFHFWLSLLPVRLGFDMGKEETQQNTVPPPSQDELDLIALNKQLAQKQLANIDNLAPYQQQLLQLSLKQLQSQSDYQDSLNKYLPPDQVAKMFSDQAGFGQKQLDLAKQQLDQQGALSKSQSERDTIALDLQKEQFKSQFGLNEKQADLLSQQLEQAKTQSIFDQKTQSQQLDLQKQGLDLAQGQADQQKTLLPLQTQLMQEQLKQALQGGRATPEQLDAIKSAADAGIAAGSGDIDLQTQRGIGLISDELANSRGLRLSDTPITREATLLSRAGDDQKAGLVRDIRARQADAALNYPGAQQGIANAVLGNQQNTSNAASNFQANLQQRAQANRLMLTGQPLPTQGINLSSLSFNPAAPVQGMNFGGFVPNGGSVNSAGSFGIGLAGIGAGSGALTALTNARVAGRSTDTQSDPGFGGMLTGIGSLGAGLGGLRGLFK